METLSPARRATPLYYQLVHTLAGLLPPPLDDTPEALLTRNHAAIAKVAALLPVNANEADLAAQCIAARAQAEDLLRLLRQHAGDIGLVLRLNAQYGSMVRTSLSVHARLMRVQALRHKREAIGSTGTQDAWAMHVAERSMLGVLDPDAEPLQAAPPETARAASPEAAPVELPALDVDEKTQEHVSEHGTDSQDAGFETWLSELFPGRAAGKRDETWLFKAVRAAAAEPHSADRELPANGREDPRSTDYACPIDAETAPA